MSIQLHYLVPPPHIENAVTAVFSWYSRRTSPVAPLLYNVDIVPLDALAWITRRYQSDSADFIRYCVAISAINSPILKSVAFAIRLFQDPNVHQVLITLYHLILKFYHYGQWRYHLYNEITATINCNLAGCRQYHCW
jgi:hypothetical protein